MKSGYGVREKLGLYHGQVSCFAANNMKVRMDKKPIKKYHVHVVVACTHRL